MSNDLKTPKWFDEKLKELFTDSQYRPQETKASSIKDLKGETNPDMTSFIFNAMQNKWRSLPAERTVSEKEPEIQVTKSLKNLNKKKLPQQEISKDDIQQTLNRQEPQTLTTLLRSHQVSLSPVEWFMKRYDLKRILHGTASRLKYVLVVVLICFLVAFLLYFKSVGNKSFTSSLSFVYETQPDKFRPSSKKSKFNMNQMPVNAVMKIILKPINIQQTINKLGLDYEVSQMIRMFDIREIKGQKLKETKSKVLELSIKDAPSEQFATTVLNVLSEYALKQSDFVYRVQVKKLYDEYSVQVKKAEDIINKLNDQLDVYGVGYSGDKKTEYSIYTRKIQQISDLLNESELNSSELDAKIRSYKDLIRKLDKRDIIRSQQEVKKSIYDLELKLVKVKSEFGPKHPTRIRLEHEISMLRSKLDKGEMMKEDLIQYDPIKAKYENEIVNLELERTMTDQKVGVYAKRLLSLQRRYQEISDKDRRIAELTQQKLSAMAIYEALSLSKRDANDYLAHDLKDIELINRAENAEEASYLQQLVLAILFPVSVGVFLLILGVVLEVLEAYFRSEKELENMFYVPCLGSTREFMLKDTNMDMDYFYVPVQKIVKRMMSNIKDKKVMFTSTLSGEGKSTLSFFIGRLLTQQGKTVAYINFRPELNARLPYDIKEKAAVQNSYFTRTSMVSYNGMDVFYFPNHINFMEYIEEEYMEQLLNILEVYYDHVIIDVPSLSESNLPIILGDLCKQIVFVVHSSMTTRSKVQASLELLHSSHFNIVGVILNAIPNRYSIDLSREVRLSDHGRIILNLFYRVSLLLNQWLRKWFRKKS